MELALVLARLAQIAAAALLCGSSLFFLYACPGHRPPRWAHPLLALSAALGAAGALAWLMAETASFAEDPRAAFDAGAVWAVASGAQFGRVASLRLLLFLVALGATTRTRTGGALPPAALLGAAAAASLAWTGHGAMDEGVRGALHLSADVLHALAAAVWIGALAPLTALALASGASRSSDDIESFRLGLVRFSAFGPWVVALLTVSGLANTAFLLKLSDLPSLLAAPYGRLLALKLGLFCMMLGLAAINRLVFTPRAAMRAEGSQRGLALSLTIEALLGVGVLLVVSWLGVLEPSGSA